MKKIRKIITKVAEILAILLIIINIPCEIISNGKVSPLNATIDYLISLGIKAWFIILNLNTYIPILFGILVKSMIVLYVVLPPAVLYGIIIYYIIFNYIDIVQNNKYKYIISSIFAVILTILQMYQKVNNSGGIVNYAKPVIEYYLMIWILVFTIYLIWKIDLWYIFETESTQNLTKKSQE